MRIKKEIIFTWQGNIFCINLNDKNHSSISGIKEIEHNDFSKYFTYDKLAQEMYRISCEDIYSPNKSSLEDFCKKSLEQSQDSCFPAFFIYLHNGNLSAFLNIKIAFNIGEIDYIYVHELYKKQGISIKLFYLFEETCKQYSQMPVTKVLLEVSSKNCPALSLYKKLSFQKISVREKYYKNGEDAVIMEKIL
jgi:ribosomal protein S18 acetylase RimI-like enzyme